MSDLKKLLARANPNDPDSLRALCRALLRDGYGAPRIRACFTIPGNGSLCSSKWFESNQAPMARAWLAGKVEERTNQLTRGIDKAWIEYESGEREPDCLDAIKAKLHAAGCIKEAVGQGGDNE